MVTLLCQQLLGLGTIGFRDDSGIDAKFEGTTTSPNSTALWKGSTIVQAKHTNRSQASFSDPDFYSPQNSKSELAQELPRLQKLRADGMLDHFLLVANRRLTKLTERRLRRLIAGTCGITPADVAIIGTEQLDLYLRQFPEVIDLAALQTIEPTATAKPDELRQVIEALANSAQHDFTCRHSTDSTK